MAVCSISCSPWLERKQQNMTYVVVVWSLLACDKEHQDKLENFRLTLVPDTDQKVG